MSTHAVTSERLQISFGPKIATLRIGRFHKLQLVLSRTFLLRSLGIKL